ncbi:MAG: hypothetical protein ACR65U_06150 [Methylocystis sp.]
MQDLDSRALQAAVPRGRRHCLQREQLSASPSRAPTSKPLRNAWEKRAPQSRSICVAKSQASDIRVLEREITRIREEHAVFIARIWLQSKIVQKGVSKCDGRNLVLDRPAFNRLLIKTRPYAADSEKTSAHHHLCAAVLVGVQIVEPGKLNAGEKRNATYGANSPIVYMYFYHWLYWSDFFWRRGGCGTDGAGFSYLLYRHCFLYRALNMSNYSFDSSRLCNYAIR